MPGMVPALEVMVNTAAVGDCIVNPDKFSNIPELIEGGKQYGMQSFDQSIMKLYKQGLINLDEAMKNASNRDDFDMRVKGIVGASDRWQDGKSEEDKSVVKEGFVNID